MKKSTVISILCPVLALACAAVAVIINPFSDDAHGVSFYAQVLETYPDFLHVRDINTDIQYHVSLSGNSGYTTKFLNANGDKITKEDILEEISNKAAVLITYDGMVLEVWPGIINGTISIQIVDVSE